MPSWLHVVRPSLALMLSPTIPVDHGALANRFYNTFLLSNDSANQKVAYGGFTQTVNHVFAC
jgi:hypothetical protein